MPLVDMSVEKLFKYEGSSPCPADIDEYWDTALAEMNALDHKAEFIKSSFPSNISRSTRAGTASTAIGKQTPSSKRA